MSHHYTTLGLTTECTETDIIRSYRRLARQHHPDKGGDPELFTQIHCAYAVLKDRKCRQIYESQSITMSQLFEDLPSSSYLCEEEFVTDTVYVMRVSLEDICTGMTIPITMMRRLVQTQSLRECVHCAGTGTTHLFQNLGLWSNIGSLKDECMYCESGFVKDSIVYTEEDMSSLLSVAIPPGCPAGMKYRFSKQGHSHPGQSISDLLVVIEYEDHGIFDVRPDTLDLSLIETISLLESLVGFTRTWIHPDGSLIRCSMDTICQPGTYVIPHHGIDYQEDDRVGHLYIQVEVTYPSQIHQEESTLSTILDQCSSLVSRVHDDVKMYDRIYPRTETGLLNDTK
jgi:DnaJ family protein A protein 2